MNTNHDQAPDSQRRADPQPTGHGVHARSVDDVARDFGVDLERGLSRGEVRERRRRHGANELREQGGRGFWSIVYDNLKSVVVLILVGAAVLAFATQRWPEGIAIVAVILVNAGLGIVSEWRARQSMEALRRMTEQQARVVRDGDERVVAAREVVPGDVIVVEEGAAVPADARLVFVEGLQADESSLTGESVPVTKGADPVEADAGLGDRTSMIFTGTTVTRGTARAVVVATGMGTEIGSIAEMTESAEDESTPLEKRLDQLGGRLAILVAGVAVVVAGAGLLAGQPVLLMIETAIALGVAAIPEGLPIVTTLALARGMWAMAARNVLVNRLPTIETLGATRVVFTDKTGTLTENRMEGKLVVTTAGERAVDDLGDDDLARRALRIGVLCNNAKLGEDDADDEDDEGDPTETALLRAGRAAELERAALLDGSPEVREVAFDPETMRMATVHEADDGFLVAVKGAPSAVFEVCTSVASEAGEPRDLGDDERRRWDERVEDLAGRGLRVLALADKQVRDADAEAYEELTLVGLVGLHDPPRADVPPALAACRTAGVRVVMVTGDQPQTASAIARQIELTGAEQNGEPAALRGADLAALGDDPGDDDKRRIHDTPVFARVDPAQKLRLVELFQRSGETVAMTGDGVNDAPALKKADIGVAMGKRGTDAARQAADMVLRDDRFESIVAAIEQGRVIFGNIRKSVLFMLCTNFAEILCVTFASVVGWPLPLRPLQILYLNVLTDVFPALALGVGPGDPRVMQRPPRPPGEAVMTRRHWWATGGWGLLVSAAVLGALAAGLFWIGLDDATAVTVSFLTLGFGKLWFVLNLRDKDSSIFDNDVVRNPWIWAAIAGCAGLLFAAVYLPGLSTVLDTRPLSGTGWGLVLVASLVPTVVGQIVIAVRGRRRRASGRTDPDDAAEVEAA